MSEISLNTLKNDVLRADIEGFLKNYLSLIVDGKTLDLPTSPDRKSIEVQWQDSIPSECNVYNQAFIKKLTTLWLKLIKKIPNSSSDIKYAEELLNYLKGRKKINQPLSEIVEDGVTFKSGGNPSLNEVTPSISQQYIQSKKSLNEK